MDLGNWDDDDDIQIPPPPPASSSAPDVDDLVQFTDSLTLMAEGNDIFDTEYPSNASENHDLPPLPSGVIDLTRKRGVLLERYNPPNSEQSESRSDGAQPSEPKIKPSKDNPFVEFHYEGFLLSTGERFDTSRDNNYPMIVQLDIPPSGKSTLIPGLELGLRELSPGEKATLTITSEFAYGEKGADDIPPNSDLKFEVEMLDVRAKHKKVVVVDMSKNDLSRLEEVRREREIAQQRREEDAKAKDAEKKRKADRAAALREKIANKNKPKGKKGGKKKK